MTGETDLTTMLRTMAPEPHSGNYVFCTVLDIAAVPQAEVIGLFREKEGTTVILEKSKADALQLPFTFVAAWITLTVHSSLEAVGLTAAFSRALAENGISCNVVAAYYHDHIFVAKADAERAMQVLRELAGS